MNRAVAAGLIAIALTSGAACSPRVRQATTYSNLCTNPESGDYAGERITITRGVAGDTVAMEWSEGPLKGPKGASKVDIDRNGRVHFDISRWKGDQLSFDGMMMKDALYGRFSEGRHDEILPRVTGDDVKACR